MLRSTVLLALLGSFLTSACTPLHLRLSAEDQENEILSLPPADTQVPKAVPKIPLDDGADWLQLVSGEWLRGKLVRIRDDKVDFDSDELDDLSLDLADITTIRTAKKHIVVTEADLTLRGKLVLVGKNLWIVGSQTVLLKRDDLLATLASNGEFSVVLCDLNMPEMTGLEFREALMATRPELAERVVFMTGSIDPDCPGRVLQKPVDPASLRELFDAL